MLKKPLNKIRWFVVAGLALTIALALPQVMENFHVVTAGAIYRSAQLTPDDLARRIKQYNIRSILNLRGPSQGSGWHEAELAVARRLGVIHYDVDLSASHRVPPAQLAEIVSLIRAAPKPILVHCKGGADRTGLVCAAWKLAAEHQDAESAEGQMSAMYGHFPFLGQTSAMDDSFEEFEAAIQQQVK